MLVSMGRRSKHALILLFLGLALPLLFLSLVWFVFPEWPFELLRPTLRSSLATLDLQLRYEGLKARTPLDLSFEKVELDFQKEALLRVEGLRLRFDIRPLLRGEALAIDLEGTGSSTLGLSSLRRLFAPPPPAEEGEPKAPLVRLAGLRLGALALLDGERRELFRLEDLHLRPASPPERPFFLLEGKAGDGDEGQLSFRLDERGGKGWQLELRARSFRGRKLPLDLASRLEGDVDLDGRLSMTLPPGSTWEKATTEGELRLDGLKLRQGERDPFFVGSASVEGGPHGLRLKVLSTDCDPEALARIGLGGEGPRLAGRMNGTIELRSMRDRMDFDVELQGRDLVVEALRPAKIRLRGHRSATVLRIEELRCELVPEQGGRIDGRVSLPGTPGTTELVTVNARFEGLPLIDPIHVEIGGRALHARLFGKVELSWPPEEISKLRGRLKLAASGISLGREAMGHGKLDLQFDPESWKLHELRFKGPEAFRGDLTLKGSLGPGLLQTELRLDGTEFDLIGWGHLEGKLAATVRLRHPAKEAPLAFLRRALASKRDSAWTLDCRIAEGSLERDEEPFFLLKTPLAFELHGRSLSVKPVTAQFLDGAFELAGSLAASPPGKASPPTLRIAWTKLDLDRLLRCLPSTDWLSALGKMDGEILLSGAWDDPRLGGGLRLHEGNALGLWLKGEQGIRKLEFRPALSTWTLEGRLLRPVLKSESLDLALLDEREGPRLRVTARKAKLDWKVLDPRNRSTVSEGAFLGDGAMDFGGETLPQGSLEVSAKASKLSTEVPGEFHARLRCKDEAWGLEDLRLLDSAGRQRVSGSLAMSPTETRPFDIVVDEVPSVWLDRLGLPTVALDSLSLRARGWLPPRPTTSSLRQALAEGGFGFHLLDLRVSQGGKAWLRLERSGTMVLRRRRIELRGLRFSVQERGLEGEGYVDLDQGSMDFRLASDKVPVKILVAALLGESFRVARGDLEAEFTAQGTLKAPKLAGRVALRDLALRHALLEEELRGNVELLADGTGLRLEGSELRLGKKALKLAGRLPIVEGAPGTCRLELEGKDLGFTSGSSRLGSVDASLIVTGPMMPPRLNLAGSLRLGGGRIVSERAGWGGIIDLAIQRLRSNLNEVAPSTAKGASSDPEPDRLPWTGQFSLQTRRPVGLRSSLLDTEIQARIEGQRDLRGHWAGSARLEADRATVFLHRSRFDCRKALVLAQAGPGGLSSTVDLRGQASLPRHEVFLEVRGDVNEPTVQLRSTPPLGEVELLHLLSTGSLPGEAGALGSLGATAMDYYLTSTLNRALSARLGQTDLRLRRVGSVSRVDLDRHLGASTLRYTRGSDASQSVSVEFRLGATRIETGQSRENGNAGTFVGLKRSIRFR